MGEYFKGDRQLEDVNFLSVFVELRASCLGIIAIQEK
jgi:hypothetical protein